jgi:hypothetical protein
MIRSRTVFMLDAAKTVTSATPAEAVMTPKTTAQMKRASIRPSLSRADLTTDAEKEKAVTTNSRHPSKRSAVSHPNP